MHCAPEEQPRVCFAAYKDYIPPEAPTRDDLVRETAPALVVKSSSTSLSAIEAIADRSWRESDVPILYTEE